MKASILMVVLTLGLRCAALRIAVVGGGVGGAASAFFLRELLPELEVDVFEAGAVGGRLRTVEVGGRSYEAGGAILHPRNKVIQDLVKTLGLSHRREQPGGKLGLFDGREFLFVESDSWLMTTLKMLWRYGLSLWTLGTLTKDKLDHFDRIYEHQARGVSFATVRELLASMSPDFVRAAHTSADEGFRSAGLSERLVHELLGATLRINYGQSVERAHEFVGFVSIAAAEGDLWSVQDGNFQVPKRLLAASRANLVPHRVTKIAPEGRGYHVSWAGGNRTYDAVVLATPLTRDYQPQIELPELAHPIPDRRMHPLVVTFVQGAVNYSTFGISGQDGVGDFVAVWQDPWFNSLSRVHPVDGTSLPPEEVPVYKVFSSAPLSPPQLSALFSERLKVTQVDWLAYPHYSHLESLEGSFVLNEGLFYLNAVEWAASAMEMSVVAAKNVALLTRGFLKPDLFPKLDLASGASKLEL